MSNKYKQKIIPYSMIREILMDKLFNNKLAAGNVVWIFIYTFVLSY